MPCNLQAPITLDAESPGPLCKQAVPHNNERTNLLASKLTERGKIPAETLSYNEYRYLACAMDEMWKSTPSVYGNCYNRAGHTRKEWPAAQDTYGPFYKLYHNSAGQGRPFAGKANVQKALTKVFTNAVVGKLLAAGYNAGNWMNVDRLFSNYAQFNGWLTEIMASTKMFNTWIYLKKPTTGATSFLGKNRIRLKEETAEHQIVFRASWGLTNLAGAAELFQMVTDVLLCTDKIGMMKFATLQKKN